MAIKIVISGIGGVGGYYGGLLADFYRHSKNIKIYFIARGENLRVIRRKGLTIKTLTGNITVTPELATDKPSEIGTADYLICCTKSYDLEENIQQLKPLINSKTIILPLLNGVNITERTQKLLPESEVWMGCVYIGARLSEPGVITKFTAKDKFWFGSPQGNKVRQQQLLKLLTDAGIEAVNPDDIVTRIWKKFFMISLGATTTSYYNQSIGDVMKLHSDSFYRLGVELKQIAEAKAIALPEDIIEKTIEDQKMMPYDSTTSMHSDFKNGKHTELETLTGYIVETGKKMKIPTPTYNLMYDALKKKNG